MLQLWATKTLEERVALIKLNYDFDITVYKLRKLYMVNGVKWRNTQLVYRSHLIKRNGLDVERVQFIKRILGFIIADEPYGFFDEMALNSFLTMKKSWSYEAEPVVCPVNSGTRLKCSVYGTIGNIFPGPVLDYRKQCTNATDALEYFKLLKKETAKYTDKKLNLILDNHAAHRSIKYGTKAYLQENFELHFSPSGTPQCNSIEHFWGVYKRRFKKLLMLNPERKWTQAEFEDKVRNVGASFTGEECNNLLRSNHGWMLHMLELHCPEN